MLLVTCLIQLLFAEILLFACPLTDAEDRIRQLPGVEMEHTFQGKG